MNDELNDDVLFDMLQGRGDFEAIPKFFPEIASMNRGLFHRPSAAGAGQAALMALEMENQYEGGEESPWNDPSVIQDYLN
jgi:hypothetical protein